MKKKLATYTVLFSIMFSGIYLAASAETKYPNPDTYFPTLEEVRKHKEFYNDPRPLLLDLGPKQVLPKEFYDSLTYDIDKMKEVWAKAVGFKAPDKVGAIAPEISPGKYTYQDLSKYPGFKDLMFPDLYDRIKPGGPPFGGNIPEFEIIPTQQYYYALPIAQATLDNAGKAKLDENGYIMGDSLTSGIPFPDVSGKFKAQKIMYNVQFRYLGFENNNRYYSQLIGLTNKLRVDHEPLSTGYTARLFGRCTFEPYGFLDERAKNLREHYGTVIFYLRPRDSNGLAQLLISYMDADKLWSGMAYVPGLRRVRKITATDTQDQLYGLDLILDDGEGFMQKLTPNTYPYDFKVIEEREHLVPAVSPDGIEYIDRDNGYAWKNIRLERRPIYLVELIQKDPNYVYSKRLLYIDQETFIHYQTDAYDQKGRKYRSYSQVYGWYPEMGMFSTLNFLLLKDYIDIHSSMGHGYQLPAVYDREAISMEGMLKRRK